MPQQIHTKKSASGQTEFYDKEGNQVFPDFKDKSGKVHHRVTGSAKEGYRTWRGEDVMMPQYKGESAKEYQESVSSP